MRHWGPEALGRWGVFFVVAGCAGRAPAPGRMVVRDAFVFEAASGGTAAGYAVIMNGTDSADVLDSITSEAAPSVTAHDTRQVNGLVTMVPMEQPAIAAHDSLVFQPGSAHLMFEGVTRELKAGDQIMLTLWFHRGGPMSVDAPVRPYGS